MRALPRHARCGDFSVFEKDRKPALLLTAVFHILLIVCVFFLHNIHLFSLSLLLVLGLSLEKLMSMSVYGTEKHYSNVS